jgi:hypothetical protein
MTENFCHKDRHKFTFRRGTPNGLATAMRR